MGQRTTIAGAKNGGETMKLGLATVHAQGCCAVTWEGASRGLYSRVSMQLISGPKCTPRPVSFFVESASHTSQRAVADCHFGL